MFRKVFCGLLVLCLMMTAALGEGLESLTDQFPGQVFLDDQAVNTIYRIDGQPFEGVVEQENTNVLMFWDLVEMPDYSDRILLRLTLATESWEPIGADQVEIEVGRKRYRLQAQKIMNEYDMVYYEDLEMYLVGDGLNLARELAKSRNDQVTVTMLGTERVSAVFPMNHAWFQELLKAYKKVGGDHQDLSDLEELYPVETEPVQ